MRTKRGLEISFAWMFSIIVGAAIIFLAVFAAVKLVNLGKQQTDTEVGKQLGILLNPIETSLESISRCRTLFLRHRFDSLSAPIKP